MQAALRPLLERLPGDDAAQTLGEVVAEHCGQLMAEEDAADVGVDKDKLRATLALAGAGSC
jgi:hypothetical protein